LSSGEGVTGSSGYTDLSCDTVYGAFDMPRQSAKTLMILKQVEVDKGLPFPVSIPNEQTVAAMAEANNPATLKRYRSFRELRDRI